MTDIVRLALFNALLLSACLYGLVRGGAPERIAAATLLLGAILTVAVAHGWRERFGQVEAGILLVDLAMLAIFVALALHAERFWPIWMSAMQLLGVALHFPILLRSEVEPRAYHALQAALAYPLVLLLVVAVRRHRLRIRRHGTDRSWSSSSARSPAPPPAPPPGG